MSPSTRLHARSIARPAKAGLTLSVLLAASCGGDILPEQRPSEPPEYVAPPSGGSATPVVTPGSSGGTAPGDVPAPGSPGADAGTPSGVPCDVAEVLARDCLACHTQPPRNGAPVPLVTYAQLTATSSQYAGQTYAARSLARMKDAARPMPPGGGASASDVAALEAWVTAGLPQGTCGDTGSTDGGTPPTPPVDAPPDSPPVCTSGKYWTGGNSGSSQMHPGRACIACHSSGEGPSFALAGTVFPSTHEPDDCNGASSSTIAVEITDANGHVQTLRPNSAGNFYLQTSVAKPYKARLLSSGKVRAMQTPQTSGDCNSCHTQTGLNGAPGRIVAP